MDPNITVEIKDSDNDQDLHCQPSKRVDIEHVLEANKDEDCLAPYGCFICQRRFNILESAKNHMETAHTNIVWQAEALKQGQLILPQSGTLQEMISDSYDPVLTSSSVCELNVSVVSVASSSGSVKGSFEDSSSAVAGSVHSNRNWFKELEESFMVSMSLYICNEILKLEPNLTS